MYLRAIKPLLAQIAASLALCACGSTTTTSTTASTGQARRPPPARHKGPAGPARRSGSPAAAHGPGVGRAQSVRASGTTLVVTVTSVIDPLRGSGANVPPGTTPVGVQVSVHNAGPGGYDSSATGDFSLLSAGGPAAPAFVSKGACQTPLRDFMNAISAGELRTGCVSFALPNGQKPTTVRFSPDGGHTDHRLSWAAR